MLTLGSRFGVLLPVLIVLHLGLAHVDHLETSIFDKLLTSGNAESHHVSIAIFESDHLESDCPVPNVTVRAELNECDADLCEPIANRVALVPDQLPSALGSDFLPHRADGPTRQARLQCFRL